MILSRGDSRLPPELVFDRGLAVGRWEGVEGLDALRLGYFIGLVQQPIQVAPA